MFNYIGLSLNATVIDCRFHIISTIEINGQLFPRAPVVVSVTSKSVSHSFSMTSYVATKILNLKHCSQKQKIAGNNKKSAGDSVFQPTHGANVT